MSLSNAARQLDALLRGGFTRRQDLSEGRVSLPLGSLVLGSIALGALYGLFMGLFAVLREDNPSVAQLFATTVKVPLLFLATLFVTFPSLYVFSALARSRLEPAATLRLLVAAVTVNLTVLASFGPVTGFFTLSTDSYPFMALLNVVFFLIAGVVGLAFLSRAMDGVFADEEEELEPEPVEPPPDEATEAAEAGKAAPAPPRTSAWDAPRRSAHVARPGRGVLRVWILIYAVVGAQMAWILRPFIGAPNEQFTFFRQRGGNFFKAVLEALRDLGG